MLHAIEFLYKLWLSFTALVFGNTRGTTFWEEPGCLSARWCFVWLFLLEPRVGRRRCAVYILKGLCALGWSGVDVKPTTCRLLSVPVPPSSASPAFHPVWVSRIKFSPCSLVFASSPRPSQQSPLCGRPKTKQALQDKMPAFMAWGFSLLERATMQDLSPSAGGIL